MITPSITKTSKVGTSHRSAFCASCCARSTCCCNRLKAQRCATRGTMEAKRCKTPNAWNTEPRFWVVVFWWNFGVGQVFNVKDGPGKLKIVFIYIMCILWVMSQFGLPTEMDKPMVISCFLMVLPKMLIFWIHTTTTQTKTHFWWCFRNPTTLGMMIHKLFIFQRCCLPHIISF